MRRVCSKCCETFLAKGRWQRMCWTCWRQQQDRDDIRDAYLRGYQAGLDQRRACGTDLLDSDLLMHAIALCHPDRHPPERFHVANDVTVRLLAARKALAA